MGKLELLKMICLVSMLCIATAIASPAQTFTTVVNFDFTDGSGPNARLIQGNDGNFYGTTLLGGTNNNCTDGCGTVFKITARGALTTLHSFDDTDGSSPTGLVQGADGNFYGTTANGGAHNNCANGCGTVYKITPSGTLTTLHSFDGTDGSGPYSGLIQGTDGNFYGTTAYGETNTNCTEGCGTVFKITAKGALTTLHSFNSTDGSGPNARLIQGTDGSFYGTTYSGGANSNGTVFKINARGALTTLHSFNGTDGSGPYSGLIQGTDGNFYGATEVGGLTTNGTVFKITAKGTLTTLHSFDNPDGSFPTGLVQGTDGNFYGTTQGGGTAFNGTVFQITAKGALTTLHNFDDSDGSDPQVAPVQATNGMFYGTTYSAGAGGYGTVFSLSMALKPFLELQLTSGKEGTKVGMQGQGFSSSSVVKFGGTQSMTVTRSGTTYLTATVPAAALTGTVTVTTGTTTLTSSKAFKVLPTITSFSPSSGPVGTQVTITGTGLKQATIVKLGGVKATSFTVVSDTEVTTDVPTGAATGKIVVITNGGSATSATNFTVK